MIDVLHNLFVRPKTIDGIGHLLMLLPLALAISIVYKTIRCRRLRSVPLASLSLSLVIVGGMMLIGIVLLVTFQLLA